MSAQSTCQVRWLDAELAWRGVGRPTARSVVVDGALSSVVTEGVIARGPVHGVRLSERAAVRTFGTTPEAVDPVTANMSNQRILRPLALVPVLAAACATAPTGGPGGDAAGPDHAIIPLPTSVVWIPGESFTVAPGTRIVFDPGDVEGERVGRFLSDLIGNSEAERPPVEAAAGGGGDAAPGVGTPGREDDGASGAAAADAGIIRLTRMGADPALGPEGYTLEVASGGVTVRASSGAGLFYGVQTLRHLLPAEVEYSAALRRPAPTVRGVRISDTPRFGWRGFMLDVSRHFLEVHEVRRFIDLIAMYKINRLHLHLSDDQGWRIEIPGWPRLTEYGGELEVGGTPGGFFARDDYAEIVAYAAERFITVVPEIDMPGHTNAALASYPELNCDGEAPDRFTGVAVGFSALCLEDERTYGFIDDVVREVAALTPGPWFHVGGDEARTVPEEAYNAFIERVQGIVQSHGKRMIGWDEVGGAELEPGATVQLWRPLWPTPDMDDDDPQLERARAFEAQALGAVERGAQIILSPSNRIYLDLKYDTTTALGLTWAGIPNVRDAYDWDPSTMFPSLPASAIMGVEAPLWSETVATAEDFEYMAFPRLAGVAEIGWTDAGARRWEEYRLRLGAQAARWAALGINYFRSPLVPWGGGAEGM